MAQWSNGAAPPPAAVWKEWQLSAKGQTPTLAHLRHPGFAFEGDVSTSAVDTDLQALGRAYLRQWEGIDALFKAACDALDLASAPLGWLPVTWGLIFTPPQDFNPVSSFFVAFDAAAGSSAGGTFVLLAARRLHRLALGDGVGLRLVAQAAPSELGRWRVRFSGLTCARLDHVNDPLPALLQAGCTPSRAAELRQCVAAALELEHPAIHAAEAIPAKALTRLSGVGLRRRTPGRHEPAKHDPRPLTYAFDVDMNEEGQVVRIHTLEECNARMSNVRLFDRDPASMGAPADIESRAPSVSASTLEPYRHDRALNIAAELLPLQGVQRFYVQHETAERGQPALGQTIKPGESMAALRVPKTMARSAKPYPDIHSDDLAATQAFARAAEFFERLDVYGLQAETYFRHAALPMVLRPRARVGAAMNGEDVNAEVRPLFRRSTVPEVDLLSAGRRHAKKKDLQYARNRRPQLLVKFGSADAVRRDGAQTLGIAADPRWAWHEFGHVLNFAATGELELPFAHSAGDALAAIVCDPDSGLAGQAEARGHTFPWVFAPRRHDRHVGEGYCWCGQLNLTRLLRDPPKGQYRHDYFGEELLSSSLFRLYRSLGGDTGSSPGDGAPGDAADLATRRSASDYCVYLIMRAIALLGPNGVAPARSADQFVAALIDADHGTGAWHIEAKWPFSAGEWRQVQRHGGRVHKVIRWAFEQQGLYATEAPGATADGPGLAPPVDVYIADARATPQGDGGYAPVPLRWEPQGSAPWHAHRDAIQRSGRGLALRFQHRGQLQSTPTVMVAFWISRSPKADEMAWERVGTAKVEPQGTARSKPLPAATAGQPLWVFAQVECPEDPSNWAFGSPPPSTPSALLELVAHDNNLGLAFLAP